MAQGIKNPLHYGLPQRLKKAREKAGLKVTAVATLAQRSAKVAQNIEAGAVPGLDVVEALAGVLKVAPGWLAYGEGENRPAGTHQGVGERLSRVRGHLTRTELGRRTEMTFPDSGIWKKKKLRGLSRTAILEIEERRNVPSVATIERLAHALEISPAWLAFGEGPDPTKPAE